MAVSEASAPLIPSRRPAPLRILRRYSFAFALLLTVVLLIVNMLTSTGGFGWTAQLAVFAPLALAAMASTPAILSGGGGFDLSISPLMVFTSAAFAAWFVPAGLDGPIVVPLMLALGASVGLANGLLIAILRVQPVVVTLSTYFVLIGVNMAVLPNSVTVSDNWTANLAGTVGPIPGALFLILAPLAIWALIGLIPYRRQLMAVGSNDAAAFSSGVNVVAVRVGAYALGGMFAGIGGLAMIALEKSASASLSTTYTLLAIAAVALGGTSLWGGRGGLIGAVFGAATVYLLSNLLQTLQIDPAWLQVLYGVVLIVAVLFGGLTQRANTAATS